MLYLPAENIYDSFVTLKECLIFKRKGVLKILEKYQGEHNQRSVTAMKLCCGKCDVFLRNPEKHRSSRSEMFFKISVPENFTIFTGKHLCWSLF